ncbi:alpha/beta hydrolase family protein [Kitasatospora sp. DSM 101779]|uniref:alpha/beta hydrolase family protein n=1 Tax=Kitasatospora sp. DSM 101779 TaxID=2853165 RepID=UPI0021D897A6|nr:alpha/beta hydrolase [Kitasatospora sp. DSM 101779]MCU7820949.1 alpha/beta hydrolase [Kitasatospora sp. DSM 101779]
MTDSPDLSFLDAPDLLAGFAEETRPRAHGAGLDVWEYGRVAAGAASLREWPAVCGAAARRHLAVAGAAAAEGRTRTAGEAYRTAARWFHVAGLVPDPDRAAAARTAAAADEAMGSALALLDPGAERVEGEGFAGWLRRPTDVRPAPVVVIVPGLDSGKEEFHAVAEALLARGTAVLSIDGPGQGVLAATSSFEPEYQKVVGRAVDHLAGRDGLDTADGVAVIGLSLGGWFAAVAAAREPRVRAAALVSGPYRLDWDGLVPFVVATLAQRCGGLAAARAFADRVDLGTIAAELDLPLLVVEGGDDRIPGVTNADLLARQLPHAELLLVPHGNHLLGTALADWLPAAADWLAAAVRSAPPRA